MTTINTKNVKALGKGLNISVKQGGYALSLIAIIFMCFCSCSGNPAFIKKKKEVPPSFSKHNIVRKKHDIKSRAYEEYLLAYMSILNGNYSKAVKHLSAAVDYDPDSAYLTRKWHGF